MWLDNLNEMKKRTNTRTKALAEELHRSERTVGRMLSGETSIDMNELQKMVAFMGGKLEDIFDGSDFKVPVPETEALKKQIEELTDSLDKMTATNTLLNAEIGVLKDKIAVLTAENDILQLKLTHKEEMLALHKYYMDKK